MSGNIPKENIEMLIKAEAMGYDGIIHYDTDAYGRGSEVTYITLGENKTKLATTDDGDQYYDSTIRQDGNTGAFSQDNPDIRYSSQQQSALTSSIADAKAELKRLGLDNDAVIKFVDSIANGKAIVLFNPTTSELQSFLSKTNSWRVRVVKNPATGDMFMAYAGVVTQHDALPYRAGVSWDSVMGIRPTV
jgi:hypothetical protein